MWYIWKETVQGEAVWNGEEWEMQTDLHLVRSFGFGKNIYLQLASRDVKQRTADVWMTADA